MSFKGGKKSFLLDNSILFYFIFLLSILGWSASSDFAHELIFRPMIMYNKWNKLSPNAAVSLESGPSLWSMLFGDLQGRFVRRPNSSANGQRWKVKGMTSGLWLVILTTFCCLITVSHIKKFGRWRLFKKRSIQK